MRSKHRKWLYYCLFLIVLLPAGAGAAEYNSGNRTLTGSIGGEYYYKGTIDTTGNCTVNSGYSATASSFIKVTLRPGFQVKAGGRFSIIMGDKDGDGMADDWEIKYGLNPNDPNDKNYDYNNNGKTNLQDYLDGTVPVIVQHDPPIVSIYADKSSIKAGETVSLSWNSINAHSCEIDNGVSILSRTLNGTMTVSPTETTLYTITGHGYMGTNAVFVRDYVTVKIVVLKKVTTKYIYDSFGRIKEIHKANN